MNDDYDLTPYQETIVKQLITLLNISSADDWKLCDVNNSSKASYNTLSNVCGSILIPIKYFQSTYLYEDEHKIKIKPEPESYRTLNIKPELTDNSLHEAVYLKCLAIQEKEAKRRKELEKDRYLKAINYLEKCFCKGKFQ